MNSYGILPLIGPRYGALMTQTQTGDVSIHVGEGREESPYQTPANSIIDFLKKTVSSVVVFSYLSLTLGQAYAMEESDTPPGRSNKVVPMTCEQGKSNTIELKSLASSITGTPEKEKPQIEEGKEQTAEENKSSVEQNPILSDELKAFDILVKKIFQRPEEVSFSLYVQRMATLACTSVKDSIVDAPALFKNSRIWTAARINKALYGTDMPDAKAYFPYKTDYNADQTYYGGDKNSYAQALATLMIAVPIGVFALKAEGKVFGYTVFDALAKDPYFFEEFYYKHPDNPYYIQNQFMMALTIYTAIMLPWYLLYQTAEFVKGLHPTREEIILKEHHGKYLEGIMGSYIVLSALSAGLFLGADYFVAAYGEKGTPQTHEEDLSILPTFLGISFTLTMYNMKKKTIGDQTRDWARWWYGDKAAADREIMVGEIDKYQKKIKGMPTTKVKKNQIAVEDLEAQNLPQTIESENQKLATLGGIKIAKIIADRKPGIERRKGGLNKGDIESLRAKIFEESQKSTFIKALDDTRQFVLKNWSMILGAIFSAPVGYLSYGSFVNRTQLMFTNNLQAISEGVSQQQAKIRYEIIEKYKGYNKAHPYEWLEQCLAPQNIRILSNETYVIDDEAYSGTDFYNSTTNFITFKSRNCKGVTPYDIWGAFSHDMIINDFNAVGNNSWFLTWENFYAYNAGVPIAANNYEVVDLPAITISTQAKILANIGAGFYATGIYGLSTLGMAGVLGQLGNIEWTSLNVMLFPTAFIQGLVKASPLVVETYLMVKNIRNEYLKWGILAMTAVATSLTFVENFIKVMKKMGGKVFGICFDGNIREDLLDKTNDIKDLIQSMNPTAINALYKSISNLT